MLGRDEVIEMGDKLLNKTQRYDGTDDLEEYITQFNLFSELNNWIADSKAFFLASNMSGVLVHF